MKTVQPDQVGNLGFLDSYKSGTEPFTLSSGNTISVQKYFLHFDPWKGVPIPNTYNGKAVINWNDEPVFAELAVLRLFQSHGWEGVWVDSYRRKYRIGLPDMVAPVELPGRHRAFIESIRNQIGRSGGCWDVFVWKGDERLFVELKRQKKDHLQSSQGQWINQCMKNGLEKGHFAIIEWDLGQSH